ncbi:hypothetical protein DICSQDRAFT_59387 [Dichomitus squalens LYAD-421 SS1]|uniref:AB hydrolase-1 domain-containing protein n=1 Tax=Dichomitus squalens (strain LYAD-421) TaxID=732165 RepID=R7T2U4_DICSQ|nr:uncharacterized protein DICSQDRAFT_59387 [Dichomitus squalens LYAD-421 SS1]EJF62062.1 hypothetical protein DICSQDRAFT_59387 [Dichomitus squalens LYAD-421 SS1]
MSDTLPLGIIADSGAPEGSTDYTTVVLFHGFAWTSDGFRKMLPFAKAKNARIFLVNRRDYPGTTPYSIEERAEVFAAAVQGKTDAEEARKILLPWMKERGREVHDLLVHIVSQHKIPVARPENNAGGIVVAGWSFGTTLMSALLANVDSFPQGDVDLRKYLRRVVFLDPPDIALGIPPLPEVASANNETPIALERLVRELSIFYSAYFKHGDVDKPETYERSTPLADPKPTWYSFTPDELEAIFHPVPGDSRGGSDATLMAAAIPCGVFGVLREQALRKGEGSGWEAVELRQVWADYSIAPMVWCARELRAEVDKQTKAGAKLRNVSFVRVEGANHVVMWDLPERLLEALLCTQ